MTATAKFPGFYRGAINLWVEDTVTRDYLRKVWQDHPAIVFYVGGGNEGVSAVLERRRSQGTIMYLPLSTVTSTHQIVLIGTIQPQQAEGLFHRITKSRIICLRRLRWRGVP